MNICCEVFLSFINSPFMTVRWSDDRKFYGRYGDLTKQYEVPLSRMLHDILDDDHIQWHPTLIGHYTNFWPLLIWTLLPNLTFYLIVQGFHRTYATGAACQQRTLTPPDTWPCPTLGLACVLMSRPISPELVLSPDFWISNIPRYFSFACQIGLMSCWWVCLNLNPSDWTCCENMPLCFDVNVIVLSSSNLFLGTSFKVQCKWTLTSNQ